MPVVSKKNMDNRNFGTYSQGYPPQGGQPPVSNNYGPPGGNQMFSSQGTPMGGPPGPPGSSLGSQGPPSNYPPQGLYN
jgi:hypothetical protein